MFLSAMIVSSKKTGMDSNIEDEANENQEAAQAPQSKLRDLKPEKDPMGAGLDAKGEPDFRATKPDAK